MTVDDLVCPYCGDIALQVTRAVGGAVEREAIACLSCGEWHDAIAGAPFPGGFDSNDFIDVVDMVVQPKHVLPISTIRFMNGLLGQALATTNHESILSEAEHYVDRDVFAATLPSFRHFNALLGGECLQGSIVLAIASGTGFDAVRVIDVGAQVTILETEPGSLAARRKTDPDLRCVGGLPHRIPFDDGVFDLVCFDCTVGAPSARALRDIVRVLKVGGRLFLFGIAFGAPEFDGDHQHASATFAAFHDDLSRITAATIAAIVTRTAALDRLDSASSIGAGLPDSWVPAWPENFGVLRKVASYSSFVINKTAEFAPSFRTILPLSITPGMVASWCQDKASGLDRLMLFTPESLTLSEPRHWLTMPSRDANVPVLSRWIEAIDALSPPTEMVITCDGFKRLELVVNGRLEREVLLDDNWMADVTLGPRDIAGHLLVELRLPHALAAGVPLPTVRIVPAPSV